MPPGRPPKRPSDAGEPSSDSPSGPAKVKLPRLDRGPEDFSTVVKNKLQSYTRTGQACDRCKVRKIRCDALPEGCSHCNNQNLECFVTDRVTGRTERRGYLQQLEREKSSMLAHIRDLEKLLDSHGVEVRPWQWPPSHDNLQYTPQVAYDAIGTPIQHPASSKDQWMQRGSVWVKNSNSGRSAKQEYPVSPSRSSLPETRPTKGHLGVASSDNAPLSSIKGTTLSILGTTIDIMSFEAADMDEPPSGTPIGSPLYNKSVMAFLQSTMNVNPPLDTIELPSRQDAFTYSEWYFLMAHPFMPILHKPSFLNLLTRIYDEPGAKPPVPEMVTVHMVFAIIYFQYGIRNREEPERQTQLNDLSNKHYHWSLNKFFDLTSSQTLASVQALAMIATHTRSFPKPGCASMVANYAFCKAIELDLHRGVKLPGGGTNIENEVRKRAWWSTIALTVTLNGRLGRPMPITLDEFDVEFPLAVPDEYLSDDGVTDPSKIGQCSFMVGLVEFQVVPLYLEMYSSIYSVRRNPKTYMATVHSLEAGMRSVQENLPDELKLEKCKPGSQIYALYTQAFCLEFRLCLRHPSVCLTDDPQFCADNTRICEETARKLLKVVAELLRVKSLDTTWYQLSVYVAALFSTLVAHWQRRFECTPFEIATLKEEMRMWMSIVYEIGQLVGSSPRLGNEVSIIIDRTIAWIEQDMNRKAATPASQHGSQQSQSPFHQPVALGKAPPSDSPSVTNSHVPNSHNGNSSHRGSNSNGNDAYYDTGMATPATTTYPPSLAYAEQQSAAGMHPQDATGLPNPGSYDTPDGPQYLYAASAAAAAAAAAVNAAAVDQAVAVSAAQNPPMAFAPQVTAGGVPSSLPPSNHQSAADSNWRAQQQQQQHQQQQQATALITQQQSANPWHDWAAAIADSQTDRYSANALLNLGAARPGDGGGHGHGHGPGSGPGGIGDGSDMGMAGSGVGGPGGGAATPQAGQWPLLLFNDGPSVSNT